MDPILISGILGVATLIVLVVAVLKIVALTKVIGQMSQQIPGTAMTAKELANELGDSIDAAFKNHVPNPEQWASALNGAVETAAKKQSVEVEKLNQALAQTGEKITSGFASAGEGVAAPLKSAQESIEKSAASLKEGLAVAAQAAVQPLDDSRKALEEAAKSLTGGLHGAAEKISAVLMGHAAAMENALQGVGTQWSDQISGVLSEHAQKLTAANDILSAQLEKIATLEKEITKVLHVQEMIEGTMKEVAASDEFKATLSELRIHLEESDKLLREVAKPRTIRLVESDGEMVQM